LVTRIGTFYLKSAQFEADNLQLALSDGPDALALEATYEGGMLRGNFTLGDDKGLLELRRNGDARNLTGEEPVNPPRRSVTKIWHFSRGNFPSATRTRFIPSRAINSKLRSMNSTAGSTN
jgi:hypothetical protein